MSENNQDESESSADMALVFEVNHGNKQAFNLLVDKYQHRVLSVVRRYIRDPIEAIDVAQEVFIRTYRALPKFRGDCTFYTWIYRIAINTSKNYASSNYKRAIETDMDLLDSDAVLDPKYQLTQNLPELLQYHAELNNVVEEIVEKLPEELKLALKLREIDGLSYDEIANVMSCPIGTVRSRIYRARETVQRKVKLLIKEPRN